MGCLAGVIQILIKFSWTINKEAVFTGRGDKVLAIDTPPIKIPGASPLSCSGLSRCGSPLHMLRKLFIYKDLEAGGVETIVKLIVCKGYYVS